MPSGLDSAGLVSLTISKKEQDVKTHQQQLVEALHKLFGSKPNVAVFVEGLKPLPEDKYVPSHSCLFLYSFKNRIKE